MGCPLTRGLGLGLVASVITTAFALAQPAPSPAPPPPPPIERELADLQAFATPELAELFHTGSLHALLEPAPTHACDDGATPIGDVVSEVATQLHRQRIPYRSATLADCSGIAHRVLRTVAGRCDGVERPPVVVARRAKDLASWYQAEDRLVEVSTPEDIDAALTEGSIAFFLAPGRRLGSLEDIFHIGMVVSIQRDADGRIQRYTLFHGRRPGFPASLTSWHVRDRLPALGNGSERMVAVAWPSDALRPRHLAPAGEPTDASIERRSGVEDTVAMGDTGHAAARAL